MRLFGLSDISTRIMARLGIRKESNNAGLLLKLFRTLEASRDQMELRCNFSSSLNGVDGFKAEAFHCGEDRSDGLQPILTILLKVTPSHR